MISSCSGIVISSIPYSESSLICKVFTRPFGLNSFLIKGAKSSKNKKSGLLRPLQPVEITHYRSPKSGLHLVKDIAATIPLVDVSRSHEKTCICLFLAEIMSKTLSENLEDANLFEFLTESVKTLELSQDYYLNFHLQFLLQYYQHLGFYPDNEEVGKLVGFSGESRSTFLETLVQNPLYNSGLKGNNQERKLALSSLIRFLQLQLSSQMEIKSLPVLESVFHF